MKQVLFVFVMIVVAIMVAGVVDLGTDNVADPVFYGIREKMEGAHSRGATLFQYKRDVSGVALCDGQTWLFDLSPNIEELRLTSQEATNLTLCKYDSETGAYYEMQDVPSPQPGDFFVWEAGGLHGLRYTQ